MIVQVQALNYILDKQDKNFILKNGLDAEFFSDYVNEFNYIKNHITQYGIVPDKSTFLSVFPDFDVVEVNETPKYLLDELHNDKSRILLTKTFNKVRELLSSGKIEEARSLFIRQSEKAIKSKKIESIDIINDTSRFDTYMDKSHNFKNYYVSTGIKELDDIIGGWDRKEELAVIIAPTNNGKSWILLMSAIASAKQGLNVGLYSGEMSANKVGYRLDTILSHLPNSSINRGNADIQSQYKRYIDDLPNQVKGSLKVLTSTAIGDLATVSDLRAFIDRENLDILFIDQHSLLKDERGAKNPVERASNISMDLKTLQTVCGIPIISVAQQNRTAEDENSTDKTRIAASYRIVQDATVAINIKQDGELMTMELTKSRDSSKSVKLQYNADLNYGRLIYIPSDSDALGGADCDALRKEFDYVDETEGDVF